MATDSKGATVCVACDGEKNLGAMRCAKCAASTVLPSLSSASADPAVEWVPKFKGLDLVSAATSLLTLLEWVDGQVGLYDPRSPFLRAAVRRYENVWLHFAGAAGEFALPPPDVEWVWLVHRLAPQVYAADTQKLCGKLVDFPVMSAAQRSAALERGREVWGRSTGERWDPPQTEEEAVVASEGLERRCEYDLLRSASAQAQFVFQTSRPQFRNTKFRQRAVKRYMRFMSLAPRRFERMIVPAYDVDMMWHSHMQHPQLYRDIIADCVGFVVSHDDSIPATHADGGRSSGSTLEVCFTTTAQLYQQLFDESYRRLDCEYRGLDRPQWWGYAESVERGLAQRNGAAVMIGGTVPPQKCSRLDDLDATHPANWRLHQIWRAFNQTHGQTSDVDVVDLQKQQPDAKTCGNKCCVQ
eukprot:TRINITY_DN43213_c0_g1_i1.p1 TRINITY_DN43213_c0_g1~~TRINITY_DN43213_c0_g1_i1.p1  ORF type:complete len:412 (+),score=76.80 TRINITY_DN43213_c0_g1_i1:84-1319(+)